MTEHTHNLLEWYSILHRGTGSAVRPFICVCVLSHIQLFVTPWTIAHQAPLSMEFFKQEYWSGLPFLPSGDLSDPGIEPVSLANPALADGFFTTASPGKPHIVRFKS